MVKVFTLRENLVLLSLYIILGKCVYFSIFEQWNLPLCQKKTIVNFIIKKLKKTTLSSKLSSLVLREREEAKTKFRTIRPWSILFSFIQPLPSINFETSIVCSTQAKFACCCSYFCTMWFGCFQIGFCKVSFINF